MFTTKQDDRAWFRLQEAGKTRDKNSSALRRMIRRKTVERAKKIQDKNGEYWVIHMEEPESKSLHEQACDRPVVQAAQSEWSEDAPGKGISLEVYHQHRREWEQRCSQLEEGLMMYRYKYEDLEKKMKLLPAPVEVMGAKLEELNQARQDLQAKDTAIADKDEALKAEAGLREKLSTVMHSQEARLIKMEAELRQAKRPIWKKLLGVK